MTTHSTFKLLLFPTMSAAALGALLYYEAMPARAAASVVATPPPAAAAFRSPVAADPKEAPAPSPAPTAASVAPPRALAATDLVGKRLSVARRTARKLGLAIVAHDDGGLRVDGEQAPYYRVRRQATLAGTSVDPGATLEVSVREIDPPSGY